MVLVRNPLSREKVFTNTVSVTTMTKVNDPNPANNTGAVANKTPTLYLPVLMIGLTRNVPSAPDLVVEHLQVSDTSIEVVIKNRGSLPVVDAFWVDVYIDPAIIPDANNMVWADLGAEGLVWGIPTDALPILPGQLMTLTVGDAYYWHSLSAVSWPIPAGTPIYAHVDSIVAYSYGAVEETHEISGQFYNNILGPELTEQGTGTVPTSAATNPISVNSLPIR